MSVKSTEEILQDDVALSLARAVAAANKRARELGVDVAQSFITVSQSFENGPCWRVNYGPRDYVGRRGGDLLVEINGTDATVNKVLRGQ